MGGEKNFGNEINIDFVLENHLNPFHFTTYVDRNPDVDLFLLEGKSPMPNDHFFYHRSLLVDKIKNKPFFFLEADNDVYDYIRKVPNTSYDIVPRDFYMLKKIVDQISTSDGSKFAVNLGCAHLQLVIAAKKILEKQTKKR